MSTNYGQKYESARDQVLKLLMDLQWHGRKQLERVAGNRYCARILELKRLGYKVESEPLPDDDGNRYRLLSKTPGKPQAKKVKIFVTESEAEWLTKKIVRDSALKPIREALESFRANKKKL